MSWCARPTDVDERFCSEAKQFASFEGHLIGLVKEWNDANHDESDQDMSSTKDDDIMHMVTTSSLTLHANHKNMGYLLFETVPVSFASLKTLGTGLLTLLIAVVKVSE